MDLGVGCKVVEIQANDSTLAREQSCVRSNDVHYCSEAELVIIELTHSLFYVFSCFTVSHY